MDEQDKDIERLFDDFADGLESRPDLARKAQERISARRDGARGKRIAVISFASIVGAAASVAVGIFAVGAALRISNGSGNDSSAPPTVYATQYDIRDVRAVAVSRDEASEYFDISAIEDRYNVFAENYYACYLKNSGEFVYVRGSLGIETEYGTTQVGMIPEKAEYRRTDLGETFAEIIAENNRPAVVRTYIDGEYISQTYLGTATTHYYVTTMGNDENAYNVVADILR